jgi:hypothetical protein
LVANTGRYDPALSPQSVTVIDTQRALDGQPAVLASIPEGLLPRDFALDGQTVVLTNFASQGVSLIDVATLPRQDLIGASAPRIRDPKVPILSGGVYPVLLSWHAYLVASGGQHDVSPQHP